MSLLLRLFQRTLPLAPAPLRDIDGKFLPHRVAVRSRAIALAQSMGRADLIQRLTTGTSSSADQSENGRLPDGRGLEVPASVFSIDGNKQ